VAQLLELDRLLEIVEGVLLHRAHRHVDGRHRGHRDHAQIRVGGAHPREQVERAVGRRRHVDDHDLECPVLDLLDHGVGIRVRRHAVAELADHLLEIEDGALVGVHHEHVEAVLLGHRVLLVRSASA